jgi:hypothetical protein
MSTRRVLTYVTEGGVEVYVNLCRDILCHRTVWKSMSTYVVTSYVVTSYVVTSYVVTSYVPTSYVTILCGSLCQPMSWHPMSPSVQCGSLCHIGWYLGCFCTNYDHLPLEPLDFLKSWKHIGPFSTVSIQFGIGIRYRYHIYIYIYIYITNINELS